MHTGLPLSFCSEYISIAAFHAAPSVLTFSNVMFAKYISAIASFYEKSEYGKTGIPRYTCNGTPDAGYAVLVLPPRIELGSKV